MKKKITFISVLILLSIIPATIYFYPDWCIKKYINYQVGKANLVERITTINKHEISYYESKIKGDKETMVLLSPLGDDKSGYLEFAQNLKDKYHLIILDLSIMGDTLRGNATEVINTMHSFLIKKEEKKIHLFGVGFGGQMAILYATRQPKTVESLILVGATGIYSPPSLPTELITYDNINQFIKPYSVHSNIRFPFKNYYVKLLNERKKRRNNWITSIKEKDATFINISKALKKIEIPTLIIWPSKDKIVDYVKAKEISEKILIAQLVTLNTSAHYAHRDNPIELGQRVSNFISQPKTRFLKSTRGDHMVKTQVYRWMHFFEDTITPEKEKHHMRILSKTIETRIPGGFFGGHIPYIKNFIPRITLDTILRYNVKKINLKHSVTGEHLVRLNIDKQFLNHRKTYIIEEIMDIALEAQGRPLSLISRINTHITTTKKADSSQLIMGKTYLTHRAQSLIHQWFFQLERVFKNKNDFEKILYRDLTLDIKTPYVKHGGNLESVDELLNFLKLSTFNRVSHSLLSFQVIPSDTIPNQFMMKAQILWAGINQEDKFFINKYNMIFIVIDDENDAYAKIKSLTMFPLMSPREIL